MFGQSAEMKQPWYDEVSSRNAANHAAAFAKPPDAMPSREYLSEVSRAANSAQAQAHNNRGLAHYDAGEHQAAISDFSAALAIRPDYAQALGNRGNARAALGDLEGARRDCEDSLRLRPCSAELLANRGALFLADRKFVAAIAAFDRALALKPNVFWIRALRGSARYHCSQVDAARGDFEAAFATNPRATARLIVGALQHALDADPDRVFADCAAHLRQAPNDILTLIRRGLSLLLLGRDADAAVDLDRVRAMLPPGNKHLDMMIERAQGNRESTVCRQ